MPHTGLGPGRPTCEAYVSSLGLYVRLAISDMSHRSVCTASDDNGYNLPLRQI